MKNYFKRKPKPTEIFWLTEENKDAYRLVKMLEHSQLKIHRVHLVMYLLLAGIICFIDYSQTQRMNEIAKAHNALVKYQDEDNKKHTKSINGLINFVNGHVVKELNHMILKEITDRPMPTTKGVDS